MTPKQLLALVLTSTITFLAIVAGGGYLYLTRPELLGFVSPFRTDTVVTPPAMWELQLDRLQKENNHLRHTIESLRDSLARLKAHNEQMSNECSRLQQQLTQAQYTINELNRSTQKDSLRLKNLQMIAEMYDRADPAEVAKILAGAENSYAAAVLRLMKRKTAARVIEQLPKDKALAISVAALDQH
jgi:septal ring factor EnvC (AmiA/AmiB activator)